MAFKFEKVAANIDTVGAVRSFFYTKSKTAKEISKIESSN